MWNKYKSVAVSYVIVKILLVLLVLSLFFIPFMVRLYCNTSGNDSVYIPLMCVLYMTEAPAFCAVILLDRLLANIKRNIVFDDVNVKYLRYISWCCFIVSIIYLPMTYFILLSFVISAAAAFFGLIIRVIKNVFSEAVAIKKENDFTI